MRLKILLVFLLFYAMGILRAQDTIRTLIISEARIDNAHHAYVELTNVGTTSINLAEFEFGKVGPWTPPVTAGTTANWFQVGATDRFMLPNKVLAPGESFVIARVNDWNPRAWAKNPDLYDRNITKPEMLKLADMQVHTTDAPVSLPQSIDSVSSYANSMVVWNGSYCWYLRHHRTATDSIVVDQVGGIFDDTDLSSRDVMHDVAGVTNATGNSVLVRKATVKKGNINFDAGRGTNAEESEWMCIPFLAGGYEPARAEFWTVHNSGDYHLSSLTSSTMTINWADTTLTVPWGVRNNDSIMYKFNRVPGIGWHYDFAKNHDDSAYVSVRTGDKLTVYACGNSMEKAVFDIIALPPTASDNKVIPKYVPNSRGWYVGSGPFCEVTDNAPVIDTIRAIPFDCRVDSLLKYLEKPANATWSFVWVDGLKRASLKKGDILRVTSQNGAVKDYYIKPNRYFPSHNAYLSSITWPDIPEAYKGVFGWYGDTIPNFVSSKLNYKIMVPWDVDGIPALLAKKQQLNAKLQVKRALNLTGSASDRTITFTNTAEDDTTIKVYNVELVKEKDPSKVQPWNGEPFISQWIFRQDYNNNFFEIVNPGNQDLDLSGYMIAFGYGTPTDLITQYSDNGTDAFNHRYRRYIPGCTWGDATKWSSTPARAVVDPNINPVVQGGDVFVMAYLKTRTGGTGPYPSVVANTDIDFLNNPWGENVSTPDDLNMYLWLGSKMCLYKILNDSVKNGSKAATDPDDFELLDVWGMVSGDWVVGGINGNQVTSWTRKPHIYKGNPVVQGSFGTTEQNSEWIMMNESRYQSAGYGWPDWRRMVSDGIGAHFMNEATIYKSTVSSNVYKVSDGYSDKESIRGLGTGLTVSNFFTNLIKADTAQRLKVKRATDGIILANSDVISNGDTLIVLSADSVNTSKYILDVTLLSNNALLTSTTYTINASGNTGTISNFAYGAALKEVVSGVTVPAGASMVVVDAFGAYQPLKVLNFDTIYVDVKVNDQIKFVVTAEDGVTKISYSLQPTSSNSDAFITSDVYNVNNTLSLIELVPFGTAVSGFMPNIIPATGATIKLFDKFGLERTFGVISKDDKLEVTAADGITKRTYYLSMLSTLPPRYFAYVLSNTYNVDQVNLIIKGDINLGKKVSDIMINLIAAANATMRCLDQNGIEKASTANLAVGDKIEVTSGDGAAVVIYSLDVTTSVSLAHKSQILVYPNPSSGNVFVSGLEQGSRISVYNILGEKILEKFAIQSDELVSFKGHMKGIYFVKVSVKGKKEVSYKVILK
jgi:hypothetical protein